MGTRGQAFTRILAFLWALTGGLIIFGTVWLAGVLFATMDVLWQLITGMDGFGSGAEPFKVVRSVHMWYVRLSHFSLTGQGRFELLPPVGPGGG